MSERGRAVGIATAFFLILTSICFARASEAADRGHGKASAATPPCSGIVAGAANASTTSGSRHSVTLSWKASVPRSKSSKDAIKGYYIYRSSTSGGFSESNRLNAQPLTGTRCVDTDVKPHGTYFYAVKAVSAGGAPSAFSAEINVVVPFP